MDVPQLVEAQQVEPAVAGHGARVERAKARKGGEARA